MATTDQNTVTAKVGKRYWSIPGAEAAGAYNPDNPYGSWSGNALNLKAYNPDDLVKVKGIPIYKQMTREPFIKAPLQQKKTALLSVPWSVDPASNDPRHILQAKFVKQCLKKIKGGFHRDMYEMCDALDCGWSLLEQIWDVVPAGEFAGKIWITALKSKDPEYFDFAFDEFMNIKPEGIIMTRAADGRIDVPLPSNKFFVFSYLKRYENAYGSSDLRAAYRAYWIKDTAWKLRSVYMERFSGNNLKGKYPRNKDAETNKNTLLSIFRSWQNETGIAIPEDLEVEVMEVATSNESEYSRSISDCNKEMAIAILGETLTVDEGRKTGARNMGEIHAAVAELLVLFLDMTLTSDINEQLIKPLIDANFADVDEYPEFFFFPRDYDPVAFGEFVKAMQEAGVKVSKKWVQLRTRMPEPSGEDDTLEPVATAAPAGLPSSQPSPQGVEGAPVTGQELQTTQATVLNGAQVTAATAIVESVAAGTIPRDSGIGQLMVLFNLNTDQANQIMGSAGKPGTTTTPVVNPGATEPGGQPAIPAIKSSQEPAKLAEPAAKANGYRRELSQWESFAEIPKVDKRLLRLTDKAKAIARPAYEKIFDYVLKQVQSKNVLASKDFAAAARIAVNPAPLKDVIFKTLLTGNMMGRADAVINCQNQGFEFGRIKKFAEVAFDWEVLDEPFTPEEAAKFFSGKVPMTRSEFDALTTQLQGQAFYVSGLDKLAIERDVKTLLTDALNNGMTLEQFKFKLQEMQIKYSAPVYGREGTAGETILDYHAETVFRTNMMSAYNSGRKEMYQDPDIKEYFPAYAYTSIMDGRETEICHDLDGFVALADNPIWNKIWPPNHHECRSTVVTINKYDFTREMLSEKPSVTPAEGFGG